MPTRRPVSPGALAIAALILIAAASSASADTLRLVVARSANESGLVSRLANAFEESHPGKHIQIKTSGSLEAVQLARSGEADALISHAPANEELFMADGYGISRTLLMYNSFAVFGPPADPLGLRRQTSLAQALRIIADSEAAFLTQGERSGTRQRLDQLWRAAAVKPDWLGYESTGGGSRATLTTAAEFEAHAFADLGSYFALPADLRANLTPLVRDHRALRNDYHYLVVNPDKVPGVNASFAEAFLGFLVSPRGQAMIGSFGRDRAPVQLFSPAAHLDPELAARRAQRRLAEDWARIYLAGGAAATAALLLFVVGFLFLVARHRLRQATARLQSLQSAVDASEAGLFDWDLANNDLQCTERCLSLLGQTQVDSHNLHAALRTTLDSAQASRVSGQLQRYLQGNDQDRFSSAFSLGGRWLELRGRAQRDSTGKPLRMTGALRVVAHPPKEHVITSADLLDPLTGLPTRQLLSDRLSHTLQQCARDDRACMVLVIGLHSVNIAGEFGEMAPSDLMVKAMGRRLRKLLRASDTVARMEEHNFAILLAAASEEHCQQAVDKLLASLQRPFHVDRRALHLEVTVGCALYPKHGEHDQILLQRAQLAMLQAKRDGKLISTYSPSDRGQGRAMGD